jgi:hypothetical protein
MKKQLKTSPKKPGARRRPKTLPGALILIVAIIGCHPAGAQIPILDIITEVAKKAVMAIDLKVQRLQTETLGLQAAQKELENAMQLDELRGIADWLQAQRDLFAGYYQELWQVKNVISSYERIADMLSKQGAMAAQFRQISAALSQDKHFSANEVTTMSNTLSAIIGESTRNIGRLSLALRSLVTQMNDADRLLIIDETGSSIDRNYAGLQEFYQHSLILSLDRAQDENDRRTTKSLYGLQ